MHAVYFTVNLNYFYLMLHCRVWRPRPIPELNAAEKQLLTLLRRNIAADKDSHAGKVRLVFTARCYEERGDATVYRLSVCLCVCNV